MDQSASLVDGAARGLVEGKGNLDNWQKRAAFVVAMWLSSRIIVVLGMLVLAPLLPFGGDGRPAPTPSWALFAQWDARFYEHIATQGYEYVADGKYHTLAFFPLFPLLTTIPMALGIPFAPAGVMVNSLAFLGAIWQLHAWAAERYGMREANFAAAVLAWFPYSLFGTVTHTEGTFLLVTTAALRAFDAKRHVASGIWGALATAARFPGCALAPALLLASVRERRGRAAVIAAFASGLGLLAFMVFCAVRFDSPIAFIAAQKGWVKDAIYWPDVFATIIEKRGIAPDSWIRVGLLVGSAWTLWATRRQLSTATLTYGVLSLLLFLGVNVQSLGRFVFAVSPISLALGLLLVRRPRLGLGFLCASATVMLAFSARWAWGLWVA